MANLAVLVCGAGGFIGSHLVKRLKREGCWVRGVDLKTPAYSRSPADDFVVSDLRDPYTCRAVLDRHFDEIYQLAADMGGAGFVFTGENDAEIMYGSATINLNVIEAAYRRDCGRIFYSSSACVYPPPSSERSDERAWSEDAAYPAAPDSEYGWEKLFSERLYATYARTRGMRVRVARYHNIFGPEGAWQGGREKAPAALCRKIAAAEPDAEIEIWGDGAQLRSFLYIDECVEGTLRLVRSDFAGPVNIGSEEMVTIDQLALMIMELAKKPLRIRHVPGPVGVRWRNSDNRLIRQRLDWAPSRPLKAGMSVTYDWISRQMQLRGPAA